MPFSPREITEKEFLVTMRGYDRAEVKAFLRAVAVDTARLQAEVAVAREPVEERERSQRLDAFGRLTESIATMFAQATETIGAILDGAQAEAQQTRLQARERSEECLRWAKERADLIVATAQLDAGLGPHPAVESSEVILEEARPRSGTLTAEAEASTEQTVTRAQAETRRLEEDLRQRLTSTQNTLRDLNVPAGETPASDRP
jgi:DivIVA domain-containing protein